jgi:hypothetical protein
MEGAMTRTFHPYTLRLREEIDRNRAGIRAPNGVASQARLAASRVEELYNGERPTEDEHRKLCQALPRMRHYLNDLRLWAATPEPVRPPPPDPLAARSTSTSSGPTSTSSSIPPGPVVSAVAGEPPPSTPTSTALPPTPDAPLMLLPRTWGEALRAAREREGWSPEDLAALLSVSVSAVRSWEAERCVPVADHYAGILEALPVLAGPRIPRPDVRDIAPPKGRVTPTTSTPTPTSTSTSTSTSSSSRSPLIAFGMSLARAGGLLKAHRSTVVALLREGVSAGLDVEDIADALESVE